MRSVVAHHRPLRPEGSSPVRGSRPDGLMRRDHAGSEQVEHAQPAFANLAQATAGMSARSSLPVG